MGGRRYIPVMSMSWYIGITERYNARRRYVWAMVWDVAWPKHGREYILDHLVRFDHELTVRQKALLRAAMDAALERQV